MTTPFPSSLPSSQSQKICGTERIFSFCMSAILCILLLLLLCSIHTFLCVYTAQQCMHLLSAITPHWLSRLTRTATLGVAHPLLFQATPHTHMCSFTLFLDDHWLFKKSNVPLNELWCCSLHILSLRIKILMCL